MSDESDAVMERNPEAKALAGVSFTELREGRCKFPLGAIDEPAKRFCGDPAPIGSPYCPQCQKITYRRASREWNESGFDRRGIPRRSSDGR